MVQRVKAVQERYDGMHPEPPNFELLAAAQSKPAVLIPGPKAMDVSEPEVETDCEKIEARQPAQDGEDCKSERLKRRKQSTSRLLPPEHAMLMLADRGASAVPDSAALQSLLYAFGSYDDSMDI